MSVPRPYRRRPGYIRVFLLVPLLAAGRLGCAPNEESHSAGGSGVTIRHVEEGIRRVRLIDADLKAPGVRVAVAADEIALRRGRISGRARNVADWLKATGAVAGVNGGYFGETVDDRHKEIVGLLKLDGRVRVTAPARHSRPEGHTYARCAFGITQQGSPRMTWVTTPGGKAQELTSHEQPEFTGPGSPWSVFHALQCGPRLIHQSAVGITYRGERLASPGPLPRTFVAYGGPDRRYLVLGATNAMTFDDCAQFLSEYFRRQHGTACTEAMCMDGGASTQAAWREKQSDGSEIATEFNATTEVPTALLIYRK